MSLFGRLGTSVLSASAESESTAEGSRDGDGEPELPNFLPEKQRELYMLAHNNAIDLNDSGVCGSCGTTLSPFRAERPFASCKNEDCENHLEDTEIRAVERYVENEGHPDEIDPEAELEEAARVEREEKNALNNLKDHIDE